jgi:hypothetical protein
MAETLDVRKLFGECANVYHVQNPVYVEVQDTIVAVTGAREEQGMFIIETTGSQNGKVPNARD